MKEQKYLVGAHYLLGLLFKVTAKLAGDPGLPAPGARHFPLLLCPPLWLLSPCPPLNPAPQPLTFPALGQERGNHFTKEGAGLSQTTTPHVPTPCHHPMKNRDRAAGSSTFVSMLCRGTKINTNKFGNISPGWAGPPPPSLLSRCYLLLVMRMSNS